MKYYIVWAGKKPGIYTSWEACKEQVIGVKGSAYKCFKEISRAEAEKIFKEGLQPNNPYLATGGKSTKANKTTQDKQREQEVNWSSIAVDAACSGNPGKMEYRGVYTSTGEEIFRSPLYPMGTNNLGEFLALVHVLALMDQGKLPTVTIYTDSRNALLWLRKGEVKSTLKETPNTAHLWNHVRRALAWLSSHDVSTYDIQKWDTVRWGEIPADFGRK